MKITLDIPDELAGRIVGAGEDASRLALEALALDGYRTERLSETDVRRMLGFESRLDVHAFLKAHGVYLHYDISDVEHDDATSARVGNLLSKPQPR